MKKRRFENFLSWLNYSSGKYGVTIQPGKNGKLVLVENNTTKKPKKMKIISKSPTLFGESVEIGYRR